MKISHISMKCSPSAIECGPKIVKLFLGDPNIDFSTVDDIPVKQTLVRYISITPEKYLDDD